MERAGKAAQKPRRRASSLARKLVWQQLFRLLRFLLLVDALVLVLFGLTAAERAGRTAHLLFALPDYAQMQARAEVLEGVSVDFFDSTEAGRAAAAPRLLIGTLKRGFELDRTRTESRVLWLDAGLSYFVRGQTPDGQTARISFDLSYDAGFFTSLYYGLLIFEAAMLVLSAIKVGREVRRTLEPIGRLAIATQSITGDAPFVPAPQKAQPVPVLKLEGAIDTLNTITAKRLDARIAIEDERPELKDLAMAINHMLDRIDAAYSSQLRFVSDASHELRTPIAVIKGYAGLLDRWGKEDPKALQESIDAIRQEADGMQTLVEQLLFLARSDNNSIVLQLERFDLSLLAHEVLKDTALIDQTHDFASAFEPELWVEADQGLIKQALRIFIDNAIKYTPQSGRIRIETRQNQGMAEVMVTDSGIGITAGDIPHVFERFYRSDESRARKTGGTGLGLSIARWIVARHNGHVSLLSRTETGTRVGMSLPIVTE